jgi:dTDP-4-dehydrorhamnose reductase
MSWYDLAKRLIQIEIKEIASEALNLKANRPKNTAILNYLNE